MTDTDNTDPRIEAVAKLLFTGPIFQNRLEDWDSQNWARGKCLMAAEDVLRGIDQAAGWQYGVAYTSDQAGALPFDTESQARAYITVPPALPDAEIRRRRAARPAGPWETIT